MYRNRHTVLFIVTGIVAAQEEKRELFPKNGVQALPPDEAKQMDFLKGEGGAANLLKRFTKTPAAANLLKGFTKDPEAAKLLKGFTKDPEAANLLKGFTKNPALLDGFKPQPSPMNVEQAAKPGFYEASALGCNTLLKAQNDGKMEWFEKMEWYKKALETCKTLSEKSPLELEEDMQDKKIDAMSALAGLEGATPIELLKGTCAKLEHAPPAVHEKPWFLKAQQMCSTVSGASNDDMKSMLERLKMQAESGSGQLIKDTCEKIAVAKEQGTLEHYEHEPWYHTALAMCAKMGSPKVRGSGLERRCRWFNYAQKTGRISSMSLREPWYKNLEKTCSWIAQKRKGPEFVHVVKPVFV